MITKMHITNFKCFESLSLEMKNLNILMGLNGMGKSTVMQSLLLLRQSFQENGLSALKLNGRYVKLGNGNDILYEKAEEEIIRFQLTDDGTTISLSYQYTPDSDLLMQIEDESIQIHSFISSVLSNKFIYLSAFRIEPRNVYRMGDEKELGEREFGNNGELAIHYLYTHQGQRVENDHVIFNDCDDRSLIEQVRLWMSLISPGIIPQISINTALRNTELKYSFREGEEKTNNYKSVNVGFGITYILPVVITLLTAREGDLILIENPEAHIHPAGQRQMGELIARAAAGNAQIIVETHSDHILNGIRLAVKKSMIPADDTGIFFFYKDYEDGFKHKVKVPQIDQDGRIDVWPEGFMDEWDNALLELL